ncbi:MAG: gluconolactonase [Parapedobacter sp.]|nr:MAG: gluconolactonase [Parapedobacter sp.]
MDLTTPPPQFASPVPIAGHIRFPEGPAFTDNGTLWCVEQDGESLIQYTGGGYRRHPVGGRPNGLAIAQDGTPWFCDSGYNAIRTYNPATGTSPTIVSKRNGQPLNMPNDLAFDRNGQLVFTCPGPDLNPDGYVCGYSPNGELVTIADHLYYPNGLAFTRDYRQLLIAETGSQHIWIGEWDSLHLQWQNPRILARTEGGLGPDGIAFDEYDNLYVAVYGSASIQVFTPDGQRIHTLPLPGQNPTNCAFDPSGTLGLVVTEAENGQLLTIPCGLKGILTPP